MNNLGDVRKRYELDTLTIAKILRLKSPNNIARYYDKSISDLTINQLVMLHNITKASYNTLLGETIFTSNNIEDQEQIVSILDNDNEYNRLLERLKKDLK